MPHTMAIAGESYAIQLQLPFLHGPDAALQNQRPRGLLVAAGVTQINN